MGEGPKDEGGSQYLETPPEIGDPPPDAGNQPQNWGPPPLGNERIPPELGTPFQNLGGGLKIMGGS